MQTEIRRENTSKRAAIEETNSALKRSQYADKLRVRNKEKCKLQIGFKIIGYNFKQFHRSIKKAFKKRLNGVICLNPS